MGEAKKTEIEWQFDIDDTAKVHELVVTFLKLHRFRHKAKTAKTQVDTYFDTDEFMFNRSNLSLRVRSSAAGFEACIKSFGSKNQDSALKSRTEIIERAQGSTVADMLNLHGKVGKRIAARNPKSRLHKLFAIKTERQKIAVFQDDKQIVEIAVDTTKKAGVGASKPFSFSRLEIEALDKKDLATVESLVTDIKKYFAKQGQALTSSAHSKYKTMLEHEGISIPTVDVGTFKFDANDGVQHYANAVFKKYLTLAFSKEWGARVGEDSEFVHQMRVSLRKFRTALKVFKNYLSSPIKEHSELLADLLDALGTVRDLDVHIEASREWMKHAAVGEQASINEVIVHLEKKLEAARKRLVNYLNSKEYEDLVVGFKELLKTKHEEAKDNKVPIKKIYKKLVKKQLKNFKGRGKNLTIGSDGTKFHKFRIAGKKLRYALEFFGPIQAKDIEKMIKTMSKLQDALGIINDCRVAKERLIEMTHRHAKQFSESALYEIVRASRHYSTIEKESRQKIMDKYRKIDWRDFVNQL